jgi:hypothetical protein
MAALELRELTRNERKEIGRRRLAHGPILAVADQIMDINGDIGAPFMALCTLKVMERNGTITRDQAIAGEQFRDCFRRAGLDALHAAALVRLPGPASWWREGGGNERARRDVAEAIRSLGGEISPTASCAWHVLGLEWSLREWVDKQRFIRISKPIVASGILIGALDVLTRQFPA